MKDIIKAHRKHLFPKSNRCCNLDTVNGLIHCLWEYSYSLSYCSSLTYRAIVALLILGATNILDMSEARVSQVGATQMEQIQTAYN